MHKERASHKSTPPRTFIRKLKGVVSLIAAVVAIMAGLRSLFRKQPPNAVQTTNNSTINSVTEAPESRSSSSSSSVVTQTTFGNQSPNIGSVRGDLSITYGAENQEKAGAKK